MLKKILRSGYYKLCKLFERFLYRHQTAIYRRNGEKMSRLKKTAQGLHSLLPPDSRFSYSLLIPLKWETDFRYLKEVLSACLEQTAPQFEVIIGGPGSTRLKFSKDLEQTAPHLKWVTTNARGFSSIINELATHAKGQFLGIIYPEDWIRPDFLLRYEQVLRSLKDPERHILYCDEYVIDKRNKPLYFQEIRKPSEFRFPYYFTDQIGRGLLIPKQIWVDVRGLKESVSVGWEFYDLVLRLNLAQARFTHLPFFLYARRDASRTYGSPPLSELKDYFLAKGLDWEVSEGYNGLSLRGLPKSQELPTVHVIIPYKDQKQMTLATLASLKKQSGVELKITAIDNNSSDLSIAQELADQGVEVLTVKEPFNYSRLNNRGVRQSKIGASCKYLLFLNNDVELDSHAVFELSRWADQPALGMIGCRLHYPNSTLQHGGVSLRKVGPSQLMVWEHIEKGKAWGAVQQGKQISIVDAVTAACMLMRRSVFIDIGGFDEVWYPIAFSDTNLAQRLTEIGLACLYTPYAFGVHHESLSRQHENIEDFESSKWLSDHLREQVGLKIQI